MSYDIQINIFSSRKDSETKILFRIYDISTMSMNIIQI